MDASQESTFSMVPRLRSRILTPVVAALVLALMVSATAFAEEGGSGPGCAPDRPAIPHHAGGIIASVDKDAEAPIPCSTATGFRTSEVAIVITNEGTVLFEPVLENEMTGLPIGALLRSTDRGASWEFINPSPPAMPRATAHDTTMAIDRQTGRVFWNSSNGPPFGASTPPHVDHSDDGGSTWFSSSPLPVLFDDAHVFTGPPTKDLEHLMQGYPNVVYACVSGGFTCAYHGFCGTHCTKSLDGGLNWEPPVAVPFPPECPVPSPPSAGGGYLSYGVIGPDGAIYLPFTPCQRPYVAISHDEGQTWRLSLVADTETIGFGALSLGMDKRGNLYAAWVGVTDRLPYLVVSLDHGSHWNAPSMIAAPGVNEAALPQLVAGATGQVAIAYYGSKNSPGRPFPPACSGDSLNCPGYERETWSTYITETWNALDQQPVFWSATLNPPAQPT